MRIHIDYVTELIKDCYKHGYEATLLINGEYYEIDCEKEIEWSIYKVYGEIEETYGVDFCGTIQFSENISDEDLLDRLMYFGYLENNPDIFGVIRKNDSIYITNKEAGENVAILELGKVE